MSVSEFQAQYLSQQPFLWLAIAAFVGLLIGVLLGRRMARGRHVEDSSVAPAAQAQETPEVPVTLEHGDYALDDLPGIDARQLKALQGQGLHTVTELREATTSKKAREALADALQLEDFVVNKWARMADFLRLDGMTLETAEFLVIAGIASTSDLASRNPESVAHKLQSLNDKESRVEHVPSRQELEAWIAELS